MKHFSHNSSTDARLLDSLLLPSLLSAWVLGLASIGLVAFVPLSLFYKSSALRLQLLDFQTTQAHASIQAVAHKLDSNAFISNLPLFLFWCLVGFIVYMFAVNIYGVAERTAEVLDEFNNYVHINRQQLVRDSLEKLALRASVVILWVPYILLFFHHIIPYVIVLSLAAADNLLSWAGLGSLLLAMVILFLALHVHTLLLRLLMLRTRVFSGTL